MGFITLEDLTGQIECLVFPKVFERYQGMMAVDDLVILRGRLSIREEESPKLLVDKLTPLEQWQKEQEAATQSSHAEQPFHTEKQENAVKPSRLTDAQFASRAPEKLFLRLDRSQMKDASAVLSLFPGSVPVYYHLPAERVTLLVPKINWCDKSETCMNRLIALLGNENVKLVGLTGKEQR